MSESIFDHKYPTTNLQELNLNWIIEEMSALEVNLNELEARVEANAIAAAKEYVTQEMTEIRAEFSALSKKVDDGINQLNSDYEEFEKTVQNQIELINQRVRAFEQELNASIIGVNARTDLKISQNNDYLLDQVNKGVLNVKIYNPFTGVLETMQSVINNLAHFHMEGGIKCSEMIERALSCAEVEALNVSCYDLVISGKELYVK